MRREKNDVLYIYKKGNDDDDVQRFEIIRKNIESKRKNAKAAQHTHELGADRRERVSRRERGREREKGLGWIGRRGQACHIYALWILV